MFRKIISGVAMVIVTHLSYASVVDEVSYANTSSVVSKNIHLDLTVQFEQRSLDGYVEHHLKWLDDSAKQLVLDTRDLIIHDVERRVGGKWMKANFSLSDRDAVQGAKLTISLPSQADRVRVYYASTPKASGLQWLTANQTAGKKHPFMYSQSQAIHARSWIPVQDTPSMRLTYSATIRTPKELLAVMSADNSKNEEKDGEYHFEMPQPIPPYLIAIGVGDLDYQAMSKQTGVYAEPSVLASAVAEFNDTQKMIEANEKLYDEYRWGQYDLLILPPAFPFGGMENPRLSFITPTVIAGDKSLVNLIAHELAHSWSGNLVTNATWRDLWLNEGFTSYVENRVMEEVFGEERAVMEQWLGVTDLKHELKDLPKDDTRLKLPLEGRDPDDAFSGVPYVKGQLFLMYLEEQFGRDKFDPFIKQYFNEHAFQSLTTEDFVQYLEEHLINKYPNIVSMEKVNEWIYEPGLPKDSPNPQSDAFAKVKVKLDGWLSGNKSLESLKNNSWSVHEWLYFIEQLPDDLSKDKMKQIDQVFNLTTSTNAEIRFAWFMLAIKNDYEIVNEELKEYLKGIGRRKFIVPLYQSLSDHSDNKKEWAKSIYQEARGGYHPLAQGSIDKIFK
ncbi:M1 family metallopeptidase [Pleionea sediminis]|uniref:M1 family metallopeptidase n=1 Tax=Pleionea sediminis TaxID=2569479 RepID=UPI001184BA78|nr:M1 family metallopeptidase [Pleionea sediminis]